MERPSEQDERVMAVVAAALKLSPDAREAYLQSVCASNKKLYEEATEAIEWEDRMGGFLHHPIIDTSDSGYPFVPGEIIAQRFEIVRPIGEGGMGVVYEALDRKRSQKIAIKFPKVGFGRLLSPELEGALKVRHPNVCLVNEIHTAKTAHGDLDFLTMELLEGETLAALLARGGVLSLPKARQIASQLCAGLIAAHRSGVIHRDLKAANVILTQNSDSTLRAVITDFGLSAEAGKTGFFGTQRYMAPELLVGQKATPASDIYALGVILYEMLNGMESGRPVLSARAFLLDNVRSYDSLVAEFLSIQPARRVRAFASAERRLAHHGITRRHILGVGLGAAAAVAGLWSDRQRIENWLQPLPSKRFVALVAWPLANDQRASSIVSGAIDAIENELARAEAIDRNLFVTSVHNAASATRDSTWLGKLGDSLGVNLALEASSFEQPQAFAFSLKLLDIATGATLRSHRLTFPPSEIGSLPLKAVQAAADLLNVHSEQQAAGRLKPSTNSSPALQAFQTAQELRKRSNDDGILAAVDAYKKAIDYDPNYVAAYTELAVTYQHLYAVSADAGVLELAGANAAKAVQLDNDSANAHMALAMVFSAKGNFKNAQAELTTAIRLDPTNPRNLPRQAEVFSIFRRWHQAEQTYILLEKDRPNYWVAYNDHGDLLMSMGRYREALTAFRVAVAAAPGSTLALTNLGEIYFKSGQPAQAEVNYRRSLAIKQSARAFLKLGEVLRVDSRYAEALAACKKAVELAPSNDENWLGLGDCCQAITGREAEASNAFHRAAVEVKQQLEADPQDASALLRWSLYQLKIHSATDVLSVVKKSEEPGPLDLDSELIKIRVLELAGKRNEALAAVTSALQRAPIRFQIQSVNDLRRLTKDPRYSKTEKLIS